MAGGQNSAMVAPLCNSRADGAFPLRHAGEEAVPLWC